MLQSACPSISTGSLCTDTVPATDAKLDRPVTLLRASFSATVSEPPMEASAERLVKLASAKLATMKSEPPTCLKPASSSIEPGVRDRQVTGAMCVRPSAAARAYSYGALALQNNEHRS
jgi:hypothetical protein